MKTTSVVLISAVLILSGFMKNPESVYSSDEVIPLTPTSRSETDLLNSLYFQETETILEYWMTDTKNLTRTLIKKMKKSILATSFIKADKFIINNQSEAESGIEAWITDLKSFCYCSEIISSNSVQPFSVKFFSDSINDFTEPEVEIESWMIAISGWLKTQYINY